MQAETLDRFDLATTKGRFPVGLDVEIYPAAVMADLHRGAKLSSDDREHLTLHLYRHSDRFTVRAIEPRAEWRSADRRFTVDTPDDYAAASALAARFDAPEFAVAALLARAAA
jgi:spore coat polysaccharide biosynthesis protein SpsF